MSLDSLVQLVFNVYEAFTVALFMKDGENLSCLSGFSFSRSFDKARGIPVDGTLPGWVIKHKEPLIIGNFDKDEETLGYYGKPEGIKSFMAYPLEMPGVVVVDSKKKWVFTEKEKKLLALFVSLLAQEAEGEKLLRDMEEEREHLALTRRFIAQMCESRSAESMLGEVLKESLGASGGDLSLAGVENNGGIKIMGAVGSGADRLMGAEFSAHASIVSTVIDGARELLLPYESGYLRERPLVSPDEAVKAKQFFGFPLILDEHAYGFLGFVSLTQRRLREGSINMLRDMAGLLSLFLVRLKVRQDLEASIQRDPTTGALRFEAFLAYLTEMAKKKDGFSLVSIKFPDFVHFRRRLGIKAADAILGSMHQGIRYCMEKDAVIARSGEGHFYVAVKGAETPEGENVLKILRFTILRNLSSEVTVEKRDIEIGTARFPKDGEDLWELLDIAEDRGAKA
jgi:GGDEF domain-containing protein